MEVVADVMDQNDLNEEIEREIDSPVREAKAAKVATRKSTRRTKQKSSNSQTTGSSNFEFSSDDNDASAAIQDMDPDFDPEVTMAIAGPSRGGAKTRKRRTKKQN